MIYTDIHQIYRGSGLWAEDMADTVVCLTTVKFLAFCLSTELHFVFYSLHLLDRWWTPPLPKPQSVNHSWLLPIMVIPFHSPVIGLGVESEFWGILQGILGNNFTLNWDTGNN